MHWQSRTIGEDFPALIEQVFDRGKGTEHNDSLPKNLKVQHVAWKMKI
jgi:hypothetical protein